MPIQTLRRLTNSEIENPNEVKVRKLFDDHIESIYGTYLSPPPNWHTRRRRRGDDELEEDLLWEGGIEDVNAAEEFLYEDEFGGQAHQMPEADDVPDLDRLIGAEVILPQNGVSMQSGKVVGRVTDGSGKPIGVYNKDPLLDTRVYEVIFPDGDSQQYSANLIAESIYMQCDEDGRREQMLDEIVGYDKWDDALTRNEAEHTNNRHKHIKTTKGWKLQMKWKDGQSSWVPLKDAKESHTIEVAKYAVEQGIDDEPAFSWWVPHVIKKMEKIISAVKTRMVKKTHKFGIEIPRTVEEALQLDGVNNNTYWRDAIRKEMKNVRTAFRILDDDEHVPIGYKRMTVHLIFDVKMDLTRNSCGRWPQNT